jgi:two-component system cell cycle sensor histidine kinase/response regulator CckA
MDGDDEETRPASETLFGDESAPTSAPHDGRDDSSRCDRSPDASARPEADIDAQFRRNFDHAPIGIAWLGRSGDLVGCNPEFCRLLRIDGPAEPGLPWTSVLCEKDRSEIEKAIGRLFDGGRWEEAIEVDPAARGNSVDLYLSRTNDEGGLPSQVVVHALDATERRALETQFAQSQRMRAISQLAGGLAHNFNNLLTAVIGFCDLTLLRCRRGDESFADAIQIRQNANRTARLVRQLLAFSRQQGETPKVLNVNDAIRDLGDLLPELIGDDIELDIVCDPDVALIHADLGEFDEVIINLATSARDAMNNGGTLLIRTGRTVLERPLRRGGETVPPGDYARIEVTDTGNAIAYDEVERTFEPVAVTEKACTDAGLRLSTVRAIVKRSGGFVLVESALGEGTQFAIYLPVQETAVEWSAAAVEEDENEIGRELTGCGRVLIVEDEDAVRNFAARALRHQGYDVLQAANGRKALDLIRNDGRDIDVIVTDVVMPEMDGPTLIEAVRKDRPNIKAVCVSGYAEDLVRRRLEATRDIVILPKPFSLRQLAGTVKEVLGGDMQGSR